MAAQIVTIESLIIDIDGVLWRGSIPLPGVADFFAFLTAHAIRFIVVTNNATATAESLVGRLASLNVAVAPSQILTSAKATALYLRQELPAGSLVLVVGEEGLLDALRQAGFSAEPADSADISTPSLAKGGQRGVAAVVVGLDRDFTYRKLRGASSAIRAGARFIATNTDSTIPAEDGLAPGAGAIVSAVQAATSVTPTVMGKPYRPMFDAALEMLASPRDRTAMLGDRLDTDIAGARDAGLATILVLTGVTTIEEARTSTLKADFTFNDLVELRARWEEGLATDRM